MKKIFFLSGLSRSGSTLLGSILNQNPMIYVTPTSPFLDLFCWTNDGLQKFNHQYTFNFEEQSNHIFKLLGENYYNLIDKPIIIDKHRGWPRNIEPALKFINNDAKAICTIRPVSEIITSFLVLIDQDPSNFIDKKLLERNIPINIENRALCLWNDYGLEVYESLIYGLSNFRERIHLIKYDDLINNTNNELSNIYDFLRIDSFNHYFDNIINTCEEQKDDAWGLKNLHYIRPKLEKQSINPSKYLNDKLLDYFKTFDNLLNDLT